MDHEDRSNSPAQARELRWHSIDINRLKNSILLSDIVSRFTRLRPSGRRRIGLCPFHEEANSSLVVTDDIGLFYCHGCQASGDVIDFVQAVQRCGFMDAVRYILGQIPAIAIPRERARATKLERARRALAGAYARCQWNDAKAAVGTPAEKYLRSRGITCPIPATIRFGIVPIWTDLTNGRKGPKLPALIGACQRDDGKIGGIQRIFLQDDGTPAPIPRPKLSLGAIKGGALRLGPPAPEIIVCEGPEDGLTLLQMLCPTPVWVALGSGNLPHMSLPDGTRRVLVAGDNNPSGRKAAQDACTTFLAQGRQATPIFPAPEFEDFNDELRGIRRPGQ